MATERQCAVCGQPYYGDDDFQPAGGDSWHRDENWNPDDGRCYWCYLDLAYDIFGNWLEPVFTVNGETFCAAGKISDDGFVDDDVPGVTNDDLPF